MGLSKGYRTKNVVVGGKEGIKKKYHVAHQKEGFIGSTAQKNYLFLIVRSNFLHFLLSLG